MLADLLDLSDSGVWGDADPETGISVLRSTNFRSDGTLNFEDLAYRAVDPARRASKMLKPGDLLLEKSGGGPAQPVGRVALFVGDSRPHAFGNFIARLRPNSAVVSEYLWYYLRYFHALGKTSHFQKQTTGIRNLEFRRYLSIQVPICPVEDQRRIVDRLVRAEGIVRLRREAQQKAAELIPAIFIDMFGDPARNPKGWTLRQFGDLGTLDRGKSRHRPRDAPVLYGGPFPFIQTGDVANSGGRIRTYRSTYSEAGLAQSKLWSAGTLCITIAANIAKTGILEFDACFPDSVVGFVPGEFVRTEFVQAWLGFLQPMLEANAPQAAQKNINLEILRTLPIPVPPMGLQIRFADRVERAVSVVRLQSTALDKATAAFNGLLSDAFH